MTEIENCCKMNLGSMFQHITSLNQVLIHCWWQNLSPYVLWGSFASSLVMNGYKKCREP